jgi:large subunit ribosomal protein L17
MRHRKSGRILGRKSAHRKAMFRNMVTSLIEHERITTTEPKAKELRRFADRTISISLRLGDVLSKPREERSQEEQARYVHALRMAARMIRTRSVLHKLFDVVAPMMKGRPGGFTRLIKMGPRPGDAAPMCLVELVKPATPAPAETAA